MNDDQKLLAAIIITFFVSLGGFFWAMSRLPSGCAL